MQYLNKIFVFRLPYLLKTEIGNLNCVCQDAKVASDMRDLSDTDTHSEEQKRLKMIHTNLYA